MNVTDALKAAGYKPEKSTIGDKFIFTGVYRCSFFDCAAMEDKGYGPSTYAQFKVQETLAGDESSSKFPEFKGYFDMGKNIASKRKGLAKLLNGFFSVGIDIDTNDVIASLTSHKGADVFIKAYKQEPRKNIGSEAAPEWVADEDGEMKQGWTFLTAANAEKEAAKMKAKKPF